MSAAPPLSVTPLTIAMTATLNLLQNAREVGNVEAADVLQVHADWLYEQSIKESEQE